MDREHELIHNFILSTSRVLTGISGVSKYPHFPSHPLTPYTKLQFGKKTGQLVQFQQKDTSVEDCL